MTKSSASMLIKKRLRNGDRLSVFGTEFVVGDNIRRGRDARHFARILAPLIEHVMPKSVNLARVGRRITLHAVVS